MLVITGAAGFVGINLPIEAVRQKLPVILVDDADRFGRYQAAGIGKCDGIRHMRLDLAEDFLTTPSPKARRSCISPPSHPDQ